MLTFPVLLLGVFSLGALGVPMHYPANGIGSNKAAKGLMGAMNMGMIDMANVYGGMGVSGGGMGASSGGMGIASSGAGAANGGMEAVNGVGGVKASAAGAASAENEDSEGGAATGNGASAGNAAPGGSGNERIPTMVHSAKSLGSYYPVMQYIPLPNTNNINMMMALSNMNANGAPIGARKYGRSGDSNGVGGNRMMMGGSMSGLMQMVPRAFMMNDNGINNNNIINNNNGFNGIDMQKAMKAISTNMMSAINNENANANANINAAMNAMQQYGANGGMGTNANVNGMMGINGEINIDRNGGNMNVVNMDNNGIGMKSMMNANGMDMNSMMNIKNMVAPGAAAIDDVVNMMNTEAMSMMNNMGKSSLMNMNNNAVVNSLNSGMNSMSVMELNNINNNNNGLNMGVNGLNMGDMINAKMNDQASMNAIARSMDDIKRGMVTIDDIKNANSAGGNGMMMMVPMPDAVNAAQGQGNALNAMLNMAVHGPDCAQNGQGGPNIGGNGGIMNAGNSGMMGGNNAGRSGGVGKY